MAKAVPRIPWAEAQTLLAAAAASELAAGPDRIANMRAAAAAAAA